MVIQSRSGWRRPLLQSKPRLQCSFRCQRSWLPATQRADPTRNWIPDRSGHPSPAPIHGPGHCSCVTHNAKLRTCTTSSDGERREAAQETFTRDIHDGIEFISNITFAVLDAKYEDSFPAGSINLLL